MKNEWSIGHDAGFKTGKEDALKEKDWGESYDDSLPKGVSEVWIPGGVDHEYAEGYSEGYRDSYSSTYMNMDN